jgi:hypothetical protein
MPILPHPHVAIGAPPQPVWVFGPLDRRAVAGFIAEIERRITNENMRPELHARIAGDTATLYLIDHACLMHVIGLVMDLGATSQRALPDGLTLSGRGLIKFWAEKPGKGAAGAAVDLQIGTCRTCRNEIREPAPGPAGKRQCKACWKAAVSAGRQRQIAADWQLISREKAA